MLQTLIKKFKFIKLVYTPENLNIETFVLYNYKDFIDVCTAVAIKHQNVSFTAILWFYSAF